jgi:tetraacyldisaccharide 4'-kinase
MGFEGLGFLGAPLAALYGLGVLARRFSYNRGLRSVFSPSVLTISIGSLEAGGTGKTPVAALVLSLLVASGKKPGLLTRGYRRQSRGLSVRLAGEAADPDRIGDEPAMVVDQGLDVPVAACSRREIGAQALIAVGCDALVLDDGFAHRALARQLDVVVLRGEQPFGNGHLLPWGTLREPATSLRRAHVVWLHYGANACLERPSWWDRTCPQAAWIVSEAKDGPVHTPAGVEVSLAGERVVAAAGIARPESFWASLRRQNADVCAFLALGDHHRYTRDDVAKIEKIMTCRHASALVVTAKDAVKLKRLWQAGPLLVAETEVQLRLGKDQLVALFRAES